MLKALYFIPLSEIEQMPEPDINRLIEEGKATRINFDFATLEFEPEPTPLNYYGNTITLRHQLKEKQHREEECRECCHFINHPARCNRFRRQVSPTQLACNKYGKRKH